MVQEPFAEEGPGHAGVATQGWPVAQGGCRALLAAEAFCAVT